MTIYNTGDTQSFFATQQQSSTTNPLIAEQVDPTAPQVNGLSRVSDPIQPSENAQVYVRNFDPDLYDLRDTSHLMRLIRAMTSGPGVGAARKQMLVGRLVSMLSDASFFDLDKFYGAIFGLQRSSVEQMPTNLDGTQINPYTDLANSDLWDELMSRDARYRARLFLLAQAVNAGATLPGMKAAAEAVLNCDVNVVESWVAVDLANSATSLATTAPSTYFNISQQYPNYKAVKGISYARLAGVKFGAGTLPSGNRGEVVFTPSRSITQEERYQLAHVLNTLKSSNTQITIASATVESSSIVPPRGYSADSENWQIQARVTPALNMVQPDTSVYNNAGDYSLARPAYSEFSGEKWSYTPTVVRATSYRIAGTDDQNFNKDDEIITYTDNTSHTYAASDGIMDTRQAISPRLSGEGVSTAMPYLDVRAQYVTRGRIYV